MKLNRSIQHAYCEFEETQSFLHRLQPVSMHVGHRHDRSWPRELLEDPIGPASRNASFSPVNLYDRFLYRGPVPFEGL